ncbi:MAG: hypothetical protein ABI318_17730 [Chthoniobacteraceae bacterium]
MTLRFLSIFPGILFAVSACAEPSYRNFDEPPHNYHTASLKDRFSRMKADLESGRIPLDRTSEKAFVISLLKALDIPATSQMLVFSTTSLQLRFITPRNPRAIFFNEDLYVGYIPGGKIELISMDPELGSIFYIFDIPTDSRPIAPERSERCVNCHTREDTGFVPGLVIKSVIPGPTGGSLKTFRGGQTGHGIPFAQRFGGWYVTGDRGIAQEWANVIGRYSGDDITKTFVKPGQLFDFSKYPVATSDILPQLVHEHQAGFANRVLQAGYRARTALYLDKGNLSAAHAAELAEQARIVTRYMLFADEVPLPSGGIEGDPAFKKDFLAKRRVVQGGSLRDFDLRTRMFRFRCSYMIYSPEFAGLPPAMKQRIYLRLREALSVERPDREYAYLASAEKIAIRTILKATLPDLPSGW